MNAQRPTGHSDTPDTSHRDDERFRLLVESVRDYAIFMLDPEGRVTTWNAGAVRLKGYQANEIIGRHFSQFYSEADRDRKHPQHELEIAKAEGRYEEEGWRIRKDGTRFWANVVITPLWDDQGQLRGFAKVTRDLTERKQAQDALRAANQELEERVRQRTAELAQLNDAMQREIAERDHTEQALRRREAELELANRELQHRERQLLQITEALREREGVLREERQTLETVNRIGQMLAAELDLQRLLQALTDAATELSEAEFGSFFYNTVDERGESYMLYTLSGAPREAFEGFPMPRNTAVFGPTFKGEGTVRLDDVTQDPRYGKNAPYHGMPKGHLPVRSYLALPVKSRNGTVVGGLFFGHSSPGIFKERHARVLEGVAAQAAVALDNARLFERTRAAEAEERRHAREAAVVAEVSVALSEIADLPDMLSRVASSVKTHLEAASVRIWTLEDEASQLTLQASAGEPVQADESRTRISVGDQEVGRIGADRSPYLTNDVPSDPHFADHPWARREGMVAFAGYPLEIGDRLLGVLTLFSRQPLAPDLQEVLGSVADILVQGIERKRLEEEVRKRAEQLTEADRRKDEFLAMLGHELRNPLSPALTALHVLRDRNPGDAAFARARDVAERQLRNMARIVDDLLDVSRITRNIIELRKEPLDLRALTLRTAEALRPQFEARRHEFTCIVPDDPVPVCADMTRIDQVLVNLLTNAAKYTDPGGKICMCLEQEGSEAVIRVRDTGVGIPAKLLSHLFELFVQSERSLDRSQGGLGIGLTLVKRLVEMHGGTVTAASPGLNQGSEFTVRLPLLPTATGQETPRSARTTLEIPAGESPTAHRILVVDDNRDAAESLAELLGHLGQTVSCAFDGEEALEKARESGSLDAILLDIGLPRIDGYQVARRLRSDERFRNTTLVALTGYGTEDDQRRSHEAGFDHHLVKPVDMESLVRLLHSLDR